MPSLAAACFVLAAPGLTVVHAATSSERAAATRPDLLADFRALAQQRPWVCREAAGVQDSTAWPDGKAECAWQNNLRKYSWSWSDGGASSCLSQQARWWSRAQAGLPAAARSVWDTRWTVQTLRFVVDGEERLLVIERGRDDRWQAAEWRWRANLRPATRRWQEGRWKLLVASAARQQPRMVNVVQPDAARMQPVFRRVLGARPGQLGPDGLTVEAAGFCLRSGNPLPGQPKLPLSYSADDSRLEQRAAMHLQLSRLHPEATWLTQFRMLAMPANLPGGAKFLATWVKGKELNSQLWMPAKDNAPTVRLYVTTQLPRGQDDPAAMAKAKLVVEREIEAIARQWAAVYE